MTKSRLERENAHLRRRLRALEEQIKRLQAALPAASAPDRQAKPLPPRDGSRSLNRAKAAWGEPLPDWIEALALACDRASQVLVGKAVRLSGPTLNQVIGRRYPGNLAAVERKVRVWLASDDHLRTL